MPIRDLAWRRHLRDVAIIAALIGYPIAAHFVAAAPPTAHFGIVAFAVAPLIAAVALVGWQTRWRIATLAICAASCVVLWRYSEVIGRNLGLVYFIQTTCTNAALALFFGRTLSGGREPLCTHFARMVRGALEPRVEQYTRQVTLAWTVFFVAMMVTSIALYVLAPIAVWSTFANLLIMPLVAVMFVVEYAIRIRTFPHLPHKPILESLRAYWNSPRATTTPPR
jgi:uncharacterized membrane protein